MTRTEQKLSAVCITALVVLAITLTGCHPTPGPDKTFAGAILGGGWGAGAGAVIGNQTGDVGAGTAIGAGFGAVSGMVTGMGFDLAEGQELAMQRELDALKVQVSANNRRLALLQDNLDYRHKRISGTPVSSQVFFDPSRASLRLGSAERLQYLSDVIKQNPYVTRIQVHGHTDDMGETDTNMRISEARARTVSNFLVNQGISSHQIEMYSHGAERPLASNENDAGRQLNRRVEVVLLR